MDKVIEQILKLELVSTPELVSSTDEGIRMLLGTDSEKYMDGLFYYLEQQEEKVEDAQLRAELSYYNFILRLIVIELIVDNGKALPYLNNLGMNIERLGSRADIVLKSAVRLEVLKELERVNKNVEELRRPK